MTTSKLYTEEQLREAFYSGISYWSPRHGWEDHAFENWKDDTELSDNITTSEEILGYGIVAVPQLEDINDK
jgi:hypothetical protein